LSWKPLRFFIGEAIKLQVCQNSKTESVAVEVVMKPVFIIRVKMAVVVKDVRLGIIPIALPHLADVYV
jgi:hypothetical protein